MSAKKTPLDPIARAMQTVPQLRAHHVTRPGWHPAQPHAVPLLGDVRHEATEWVFKTAYDPETAMARLKAAGVTKRARVKVARDASGQTWASVTLRGKATDRDALAKALGIAGQNPALDVRGWYPADHKLYAKHVKKAFR